ncbi:MAG: M56 family metallopeptidase [Tannerella sp.]|jgi:TonB family protein|nr:M56 family metallopeptidase [Tannerella sp.]
MGAFFAYSLQSAICLAVFYLFYKVLLSRETFHRFNRIALLGVPALSLIIPLLPPFRQASAADADVIVDAVTSREILSATDLFPGNMNDAGTGADGGIIWSFLLIAYLSGCVFCLIYAILSAIRLMHLIKGKEYRKTGSGTKLVILNGEDIAPFSWMRYVVLSRSDYEEAGETILAHENAHVRLNHTYDLMIAQVCIIMQWYNPAVWLLYRELQNIHEYEADDEVLRRGINAKQYQLLIIKKAVGSRLYSMANSFNHSNLKKRITMMLQKKSNSRARLKYAYVLPLAAMAIAAFAHPEISRQFEEISNAKISHFALKTSNDEVKNFPGSNSETVAFPETGTAEMTAAGQTSSAPGAAADNNRSGSEKAIAPNDTVYVTAEEMPEFPGGDAALLKFIADSCLRYPAKAKKNHIEGRVSCTFTVNTDGSISDVQVIRSVDPELDAEAIRAIQSLPNFKPGKMGGKAVRVKYSLPIRFRLPAPPPPPPMN